MRRPRGPPMRLGARGAPAPGGGSVESRARESGNSAAESGGGVAKQIWFGMSRRHYYCGVASCPERLQPAPEVRLSYRVLRNVG